MRRPTQTSICGLAGLPARLPGAEGILGRLPWDFCHGFAWNNAVPARQRGAPAAKNDGHGRVSEVAGPDAQLVSSEPALATTVSPDIGAALFFPDFK